jgi:hypothetical protein
MLVFWAVKACGNIASIFSPKDGSIMFLRSDGI